MCRPDDFPPYDDPTIFPPIVDGLPTWDSEVPRPYIDQLDPARPWDSTPFVPSPASRDSDMKVSEVSERDTTGGGPMHRILRHKLQTTGYIDLPGGVIEEWEEEEIEATAKELEQAMAELGYRIVSI